ncbi:MAG: hypothetical protein E6Q97_09430 [Desulfurellales bacterium]|nr:MAG: hypothetical protein E6Q97_09430 [Desulfurellales bacterium]
MTRHLFAYLAGSTFASIVLAVVSMLAGQWFAVAWLVVIAVVSLLGVMVVRAVELTVALRREMRA